MENIGWRIVKFSNETFLWGRLQFEWVWNFERIHLLLFFDGEKGRWWKWRRWWWNPHPPPLSTPSPFSYLLVAGAGPFHQWRWRHIFQLSLHSNWLRPFQVQNLREPNKRKQQKKSLKNLARRQKENKEEEEEEEEEEEKEEVIVVK